VGAGVGALAGALKGGVGTASVVTDHGVTVGALIVANPVGSVLDPGTGLPWGDPGPAHRLRPPEPAEVAALAELAPKTTVLNTTIGVVASDAALSKSGCRRVAMAAHDGLARAVRPAHSPLDGDTIFALATATAPTPRPVTPVPAGFAAELPLLAEVCAAAAVAVERAVVDAVLSATSVAGVPAYRDVAPSAL
jgi:L-aminopeptidase/D-esterase-like protein